MSMTATKRVLGINYVTGTGVILGGLSVPALLRPETPAVIVASLGVAAAIGLASTGVWLGSCRLRADQVWRVATHAGLGIGLVTLSNLFVVGIWTVGPPGTVESTILASAIAIGGVGGAGLGVARELDRSARTLTQSTEVLSRALRHNLRNDMTVILGQLDELEADVSGPAAEHVRSIRRKVDDVVTLSEQAQQIEAAVTGTDRQRHPVDAVEFVDRRVRATRAANPEVRIEADLPATAWVNADWMLETAIENVLRTAIANGGAETVLEIGIEHPSPGWTDIRIVDVEGHLPNAEVEPLNSGAETPLQHGEGLGLWLVNWIVEGFGGDLDIRCEDGVSVVVLRVRRALPAR